MVATQNHSFRLPDYEERLWDELRALHEAEQEPGTRLQGRRGGRFHRSRRATYLGAVAAAALVALVAAVVVMRNDGDRTQTGPAQPQPTTTTLPSAPSFPTVAFDPPPPDSVDVVEVYEQTTPGVGTMTQFYDEVTRAHRFVVRDESGQVDVEWAWTEGGPELSVLHHSGTYAEGAVMGFNPGPTEAARNQVQGYTPEGTEVIDGVELLRYVQGGDAICAQVPEEVCESVGPPGDNVIWLDPDTLRPVRDQQGESPGRYAYLPRTPENGALVELSIPDGYQRVEPTEISGGTPRG